MADPENVEYYSSTSSSSFSSSCSSDIDQIGEGYNSDGENNEAIQQALADAQFYIHTDDEIHGNPAIYTREVKNSRELLKQSKEIMAEQSQQFMIQVNR